MSRPTIDDDLVRQLAKLLDETGLTEIEYGEGKWHLRVSKSMTTAASMVPAAAAAAAAVAAAGPAATAAAASADDAARHPGAVTSPMVGTVYVAPEPGAAPFVKTGDTVSEGQTLLLIEAMKTMNPIKAPRAGRVSQIFITNAAPVEYGEVLLILE
jgi:acetyl-CoA carboxylase biotin carboxyl carrier protein